MYRKLIELFLVNGTAESLTTAELSNWNGKAIKIPHTVVKIAREYGRYIVLTKNTYSKTVLKKFTLKFDLNSN